LKAVIFYFYVEAQLEVWAVDIYVVDAQLEVWDYLEYPEEFYSEVCHESVQPI